MEILAEIETRRAARAVGGEDVPAETLERVLRAATLAPSCFNNQPWRLVAVRSEPGLTAMRAALSEGNAWAARAPVIVAILTKPGLDCRLDEGRDYAFFDAGLCAMNLVIQATHEGLVAHPIAGYNPKKAKAAVGAGADYVPIALVVIGWPGDDALLSERQKTGESAPRERKSPAETVAYDRFDTEWK